MGVPAFAAGGGTSEKLVSLKIVGAAQARAGSVTFKVANTSTARHELVVIRTATTAAELPLRNGRASEQGRLGEVELEGGRAGSLELTLEPGRYVLLCNVGNHDKRGMRKDFTVT